MIGPTVSIGRKRKDGSTVWCVWTDGMGIPVEPTEWGVAPSRLRAVTAAAGWLGNHGIATKPRNDRGRGAAWWAKRMPDYATHERTRRWAEDLEEKIKRDQARWAEQDARRASTDKRWDEILAALLRDASPDPKHLTLLNLPWPCTHEQLIAAWRSAARKTHPDAGGSHHAFVQTRAAYENLAKFVAYAAGGR